jgi:predicted transposase YdaD
LHRGADSPQLTGLYERGFPGELFDVALRYRSLRVWEVPTQRWLTGGIGLMPLALLADVPHEELPAVVEQMKQRLDQEAPPGLAAELWSAAYILLGLRYEPALIHRLLQGVLTMEESSTYQAILQEGRTRGITQGKIEGQIEEARKILLLQGRNRFGEASPEAEAAVQALTDVQKLEELIVRVLETSSWQELLGLHGPSRRGRGRKKTS